MREEVFRYDLKIPKERIAVLIGKDGNVKAEIESFAKIKLNVDSKEGEIFITGKDPISLYSSKEVIQAIARGFNPEIAMLLFKQDYGFELVNILDFARTKNDMIRLKGRIIGTEGKSRAVIEQLSETYISVYGKTIGIIGELDLLPIARKAVEMLLEGSQHANVFKFLEKKRRSFRMHEDIEIREDAKKYKEMVDDGKTKQPDRGADGKDSSL